MATVAAVTCGSYQPEEVRDALERALVLLGGVGTLTTPGEPLLFKPNLLAPDPPERCVTTHPAVFEAAVRLFQEAGARIHYGDSPGMHRFTAAAEKSGLADVARRCGVPAADFDTPVPLNVPAARQNKTFLVAQAARAHRGAIINLPKLKTHGLERLTGAVKNLFGCVPGLLKAEFHVKLPDARDFARMLVDLCLALKPRLHILDAVMAMEGNGPRSGSPAPVRRLLVSTDPVALDAAAARLVGLDPAIVPTIVLGAEAGLGVMVESDITRVGDGWEPYRSFRAERAPIPSSREGGRLARRLKQWLVPRPVIRPEHCTRCGTCVKACPVRPKAVDWPGRPGAAVPEYAYHRCIRCYCCQEMCPERAIDIHTPLLGRLIRRR